MKSKLRSIVPKGFTLIEMMVGMIIFVIGLVGFAGMVMMQAQGNRTARGLDEAATLVQSAVEDLLNVDWNALGNDTSLPSSGLGNGLTNGTILTQGPLNKKGDTIGTGSGPYSYYRSIVICQFGQSASAGSQPYQYCGSTPSTSRPPELHCDNTLATTDREKIVRVLVSWTERSGKCHWKHTDAMSYNW